MPNLLLLGMGLVILLLLCLAAIVFSLAHMARLISRRGPLIPPRVILVVAVIAGTILSISIATRLDDPAPVCCHSPPYHPDYLPVHLAIAVVGAIGLIGLAVPRTSAWPPLLALLLLLSCLLGIGLVISYAIHEWPGENFLLHSRHTESEGNMFVLLTRGGYLLTALTVITDASLRPRGFSDALQTLTPPAGTPAAWALWLLRRPLWQQLPVLTLLLSPLLLTIVLVTTLFGQRYDAVVLAFTQTHYYRFSQLTDACRNVDCGGHYLCSVAAAGHTRVVRPLRLGVRHGGLILCNRQLLIANAFEELLWRWPRLHAKIRRHYDRLGDLIHGQSDWFARPGLATATYLSMKPAEWTFTVVLYLCDAHPERRISRQYLGAVSHGIPTRDA